jgi:pimeloyl-ACP methyl ester carboxylesterase
LPAYGIGVFAYDKRGTGASEGEYTQDFDILAGDAVRARKEAARLAGDGIEVGYLGGSQGGWVAPLAASMDGAAFVIAAYGLAIRPELEDEEEVVQTLRERGYSEEGVAKAREVTAATRTVVFSNFKRGFKELSAARKRYRDEPWFDDLEGGFTGRIVDAPNIILRIVGPFMTGGLSLTHDYEPVPVLEALEAPQLWILAGEDRSAPSASTIAILRDIQTRNQKLDIVVFPETDHGILRFVEAEDGTRDYTGVADGYHRLIRDYILTGDPEPSVSGLIFYPGDGREGG